MQSQHETAVLVFWHFARCCPWFAGKVVLEVRQSSNCSCCRRTGALDSYISLTSISTSTTHLSLKHPETFHCLSFSALQWRLIPGSHIYCSINLGSYLYFEGNPFFFYTLWSDSNHSIDKLVLISK